MDELELDKLDVTKIDFAALLDTYVIPVSYTHLTLPTITE